MREVSIFRDNSTPMEGVLHRSTRNDSSSSLCVCVCVCVCAARTQWLLEYSSSYVTGKGTEILKRLCQRNNS